MSWKTKKLAWLALCMILLLGVFIFLIEKVDVFPAGPLGRIVGLSSINGFLFDFFEANLFWYEATNLPGMIIDALVVCVFAVIGLKQWVQRRNILKVDRNILVLGGIYLASFLIYVFFEKLAINYRPIILPGEKILEPSFPSSHTLFAVVVMGTAIMECHRLIKNIRLRRAIDALLYAIAFVTIIGRMISGVHWFTDIVGGIIIGCTLLIIYALLVSILNDKFDGRIKRFYR